jgi:hypothetical protein
MRLHQFTYALGEVTMKSILQTSVRCISATVLAMTLCLIMVASASASFLPMAEEEIIQISKVIFVGSVAEKKARWNDRGNLIVTDYTFDVEEVLYGDFRDRLVL